MLKKTCKFVLHVFLFRENFIVPEGLQVQERLQREQQRLRPGQHDVRYRGKILRILAGCHGALRLQDIGGIS